MARDPDWLLDCTPREVQLEALRRSYLGLITRDSADGEEFQQFMSHYGRPATSWAHFMEMRLGKTATLLNEFMLLKRDGAITRLLVVSPNSFKDDWGLEAANLGVDVPVHVFNSKKRKHAQEFVARNREGMLVVNYEAVSNDADREMLLTWCDGQMIGADESVKIKNPSSGLFKGAYAIAEVAAYKRVLTGLPAPQSVADLWSQFRFIGLMKSLNFFAFKARFAVTGGFRGKKVIGVKNEHLLHEFMADNAFVAARKDWGGYTKADYQTLSIPMSPKQTKAYDDMELEFVTWLDETEFVTADQVITKYIKLQQISSGFIMDEFGDAHDIEPFNKTHKFKSTVDLLDDYVAGKVIIIAKYRHTIDQLYSGLSKYNPAIIRGAAHMKSAGLDVVAEKERFNNDPACRVLIGQQVATKYGHTLMGTDEHPCSTMVFYENSYSLDDRMQVEQRPQGFGQKGPTHIIDFATSEVERSIVRALQKKQAVSDVIMNRYAQSDKLT